MAEVESASTAPQSARAADHARARTPAWHAASVATRWLISPSGPLAQLVEQGTLIQGRRFDPSTAHSKPHLCRGFRRSRMLPSGHIAAGILLGAHRTRRSGWRQTRSSPARSSGPPSRTSTSSIPTVLDNLGVEHQLCSGRHHSWMTHTPLFWGSVLIGVRSLVERSWAPAWAPEAAQLLAVGVALHPLRDFVANTVALLWPLRGVSMGLALTIWPRDRPRGVHAPLSVVARGQARGAARARGGRCRLADAHCGFPPP